MKRMKVLNIHFSKRVLTIIIGLLIVAMFSTWYFIADQKIETASYTGIIIGYDTIDELKAASDLVVVAVPTGFKRNVVFGKGMDSKGWTLSEIKVDKIIKADPNPKQDVKEGMNIIIREPYYIVDKVIEPGKFKIKIEDYTELISNLRYVLFLKWDERSGTYAIYTAHQGKYNIDGRDTEEIKRISGHVLELKREILERFH